MAPRPSEALAQVATKGVTYAKELLGSRLIQDCNDHVRKAAADSLGQVEFRALLKIIFEVQDFSNGMSGFLCGSS